MGEVKVFFGFLAGWRDLSRALMFSTCSRRYSRAAGTRMRQHPVPSRAASVVLAVQATYDLQSADFFRFFIRNLRFALIVSFGFFHEEYHIVCVDLIVALRRTKGRGRRTLRSPPSPSSGLHLIHPGVSAAAGKYRLPRVWGNLGSLYPVQIAHRQFGIWFGYRCSVWYRSRFSRFRWACIVRFSLVVDRLFVSAATECFAMVYRWICADRDWVVCLGW